MNKNKKLLAALTALAFLLTNNMAYTQEPASREENAESHATPDSAAFADFLQVALSDSIWNADTMIPEDFTDYLGRFLEDFPDMSREETQKRYAQEKRRRPWLADYVVHPHGWPKTNVINKWQGEISIGIDWPPYSSPESGMNRENDRSDFSDSQSWIGLEREYGPIAVQVEKLAPEIEKLTGLPVRFVRPGDPQDRTDKFARIRIVPIAHTYLHNPFKTLGYLTGRTTDSPWTPRDHEDRLWGGVPFTPRVRAQVDGYLLPNPDNTVGMAVCKIDPSVYADLMRPLIAECLARALGLPDLSAHQGDGVLTNWNKQNDPYSKLPVLDGREALNYLSGQLPHNTKLEFIVPDTVKDGQLETFTSYDRFMITLLYCPAIKPGMGAYELLQVFSKNQCVAITSKE